MIMDDLFAAHRECQQRAEEFNAERRLESLRRVETPAARRSDPETSHLAAAQHTASGERAYQLAQAVAAVRTLPGRTSFELALATDLDRYMLARRLPEAITAGAVKKGDQRACKVTGRQALTWWPATTSGTPLCEGAAIHASGKTEEG